MSNLQCDLVADLLPIYIDGKSSDATREFIEKHVKTCEDCRVIYESMTADMPVPAPEKTRRRFKLNPVIKIMLGVLGYLFVVILLAVIVTYILVNGVL